MILCRHENAAPPPPTPPETQPHDVISQSFCSDLALLADNFVLGRSGHRRAVTSFFASRRAASNEA